ncbi:ATP-binding protein [Alistipes communis]|uniref:ATP-binding protein n=1 Tax=Alistipes communis TaxID=2585118 RepID=UPI0030771B6D
MIKPKERETIIQSLKSGVVPRLGLQHIQVGRSEELKSFVNDVTTIAEGGTSFRFVIGEYGSGKTFFLSLVRSIALQKGLVTMNADLSPTKRLHGTDGHARVLLSELISSISTRTKQDGNALPNILEKFISKARAEAEQNSREVASVIYEQLSDLNEYSGGYTFAQVVNKYWTAYESGDDMLKDRVLRWLKAEYTTKTDSLRDLGVREFINDASFFNTLKLYSILVQKAGYSGLLVCMDEMVNLYKISNSVSRKANYEEILNILNNTLQGTLSHIGFIMSGTPEFLTDGNRGLYSYEALKSRLAENCFSKSLGLTDYNSTVLRLANLTKEELYLLLMNLRNVFAGGDESKYLVPNDALLAYLNHCANKIGDSYFRTPRNTIKGFLDLLSMLEQYPDLKWSDMIEQIEVVRDVESTEVGEIIAQQNESHNNTDDDAFASFKL